MRYAVIPFAAAAMALATPAAATSITRIVCVRDLSEDEAKIRTLFDRVDRMDVSSLFDRAHWFHVDGRDHASAEDFVLYANFSYGREDAEPLRVTAIRRVEMPDVLPDRIPYVVRTTRSKWLLSRSVASGAAPTQREGRFFPQTDYWLVSFRNCDDMIVREIPELGPLFYEVP